MCQEHGSSRRSKLSDMVDGEIRSVGRKQYVSTKSYSCKILLAMF